jgi:hypothetical protein
MIMAVMAGRQEQLSFQAALSKGMHGLLVSDGDTEGNGSIQSQILHFAKLPSTLRHRQGIKSSSLPPHLSLSKSGNFHGFSVLWIKSLAPLCQDSDVLFKAETVIVCKVLFLVGVACSLDMVEHSSS